MVNQLILNYLMITLLAISEIPSNDLSGGCQLFYVQWKQKLCFSFEIHESGHVKDQIHEGRGYTHATSCITISIQPTGTRTLNKTDQAIYTI